MSRPSKRISTAPMALASDGSILVNAAQLTTKDDLAAVVECARASGLPVFVGVIVPDRLRKEVLRDLDDAAADIVGRLGARLAPKRSRRP